MFFIAILFIYLLLAKLHACVVDQDCDFRAKCQDKQCICQGNRTGNGENCRGTVIKVHTAWKIFSAYLKGISKYRRKAFFFLKYLFFYFRDIDVFLLCKLGQWWHYIVCNKNGKYWVNDISGNIEAVLLKRGTKNVHHKRNTMTPFMALPWQQFGHRCCLDKN